MDTYGLDINNTRAALEAAGLRVTYYGDGVFGCGDTAADHPSTEAAYGEVRLVVQPAYRMFDATTTVSVVWYDDEGDVVDGDDGAEFDPADLDGIVARVRDLIGGAA